MKILAIQKDIKNIDIYNKGYELYKKALEGIGYTVEITHKVTNKVFTQYNFNNSAVGSGTGIKPEEILAEGTGHRLNILTYSTPNGTNPAQYPYNLNGTSPISLPEFWYGNFPEVMCEFLLHETGHAAQMFAGEKDTIHEYLPQYSTRTQYYLDILKRLKPILDNQMPTNTQPKYKYFSAKEIVGLKPELVQKLDTARGIAGFPFPIISGKRTLDRNEDVGGVENSSHLTGEAVDLSCPDSVKRMKMVKALLEVGFNRIGINKTSIHADISKTLPQNVIWTYYK
jgi:uncharacterized protein YcbK (DUF882 family)